MSTEGILALDAEIHRTVFGRFVELLARRDHISGEPIPAYSTDIAAAWLVVKRLADGMGVRVRVEEGRSRQASCHILAVDGRKRRPPDALVRRDALAYAETAPLAICRAALDAVALTAPIVS